MLNDNTKYPYPLIRETPEDFEHTVFEGNLEVLRENNGFRVVPSFSVNNESVVSLINDGVFCYAIQLRCRSTYYRSVEYIKDNNPVFIPSGHVHDLVELCPCIIATQDIDNYYVEDFVTAFKQSPVHIYKNDVVGIGKAIRFRAYYKADEVKKASSIVTIQADDSIDRIKVDMTKPNIIVRLPQSQYDEYIRIGTSTTDQVTLLSAVVSVPVILMALSEIDPDDDSEYADLAWYKSLRAILDRVAEGDPVKVNSLLEDRLNTAQMLLGDNLSVSLSILDNREW